MADTSINIFSPLNLFSLLLYYYMMYFYDTLMLILRGVKLIWKIEKFLKEEKLSLTSELSKLRVALEEDNRQLEVYTNRLNELNNDYKKAKIDSSSVSEDISKLTKRKYELTNKLILLKF